MIGGWQNDGNCEAIALTALFGRSRRQHQPVSSPADGLDIYRVLGVWFKLFSQTADSAVDGVAHHLLCLLRMQPCKRNVKNVFGKCFAMAKLVGMVIEVFEEPELLRR